MQEQCHLYNFRVKKTQLEDYFSSFFFKVTRILENSGIV